MIQAVKSVAILKANLDQGKEFLDNFIPFIASIAKEKKYERVDIKRIQDDFLSTYGLKIPYHALRAILSKCIHCKLIKPNHDGYLFITAEIEKQPVNIHNKEKEIQLQNLLVNFNEYSSKEFNKVFTENDLTNLLVEFLKKYDAELLIDESLIEFEPEEDFKNSYIFNSFVVHIYNNEKEDYEILVELAVGYLFASIVFFNKLEKKNSSIKNSKLFLDTRLLLRLVGVEGTEREGYYKTLIELLKDGGAKLRVFEHTMVEIEGILDDCSRLIEKDEEEIKYIGPSLRFFIEENYTRSDIVLFKSQLERILSDYGIRIEKRDIINGSCAYFIDEKELEHTIYEEYKIEQDSFLQWKKHGVILRDVKSISLVRQIRDGYYKSVKRAKSFFVTTNKGLAIASKKYILKEKNEYFVPECITDVYLGTLVWLENPPCMKELQYRKIITDSLSYLNPDAELIALYTQELKKLKESNQITEDEYFYLRTQSVINRLKDKVYGDPAEFTDKLPQELLHEFRSKIINPVEEKYKNILSDKNMQIGNMNDDIDNKTDMILERDLKISTVEGKTKKISKYLTYIIVFLITLLLVSATILSIIKIENQILSLISSIVLGILSIMNIIFGFSLKWFFKKLENTIYNRLREFLFEIEDHRKIK